MAEKQISSDRQRNFPLLKTATPLDGQTIGFI
jgi:hypothetical protein